MSQAEDRASELQFLWDIISAQEVRIWIIPKQKILYQISATTFGDITEIKELRVNDLEGKKDAERSWNTRGISDQLLQRNQK